jgi:tetratricopeptide (TPR) repeat protein/CHAT domain-containing protein
MTRIVADEPNTKPPLTAAQQARLKEGNLYALAAINFLKAGKHAEAVAALERKIAIERDVFGNKHDDVADSLAQQADIHEQREDFTTARKMRDEVLEIRIQLHADTDWRVADARRALADLERLSRLDAGSRQRLRRASAMAKQGEFLCQQGQYQQALTLARPALEIQRQILGEEHPVYATSLNNLAFLYQSMSDYRKALPTQERGRELRKKLLGEEHPDYAATLNNLAELYREMGDYPKALPLCERARDLHKKLYGEEHPAYVTSLNNLGSVYDDMGDYAKAMALYEQARELCKKLHGEEHPSYARSLHNLGGLYREMGDYAKALRLYTRALELHKKLHGEEHPHYALSLNSLAGLYRAMGDYSNALPLYERARELRKKLHGEEHPAYGITLNDMAGLYLAMENYPKALALLERAHELTKKLYGEEHPHYAASLNNLAELYRAMGDYPKALPLFERAGELTKKLEGEEHPHYAICLINLAGLYQATCDYPKALRLYGRARDLNKELLGQEHPHYALSLTHLAWLYYAMGNPEQAGELGRQALQVEQHFLDKTFTAQSDRQRLNLLGQHRGSLDLYFSVAPGAGTPAAQAYESVMAWKGALASRHADERVARDQPVLKPLVERLRMIKAGLTHLARTTPVTAEQQADWRKRFDELDADKEKLEAELAHGSEAFRRFRELRHATVHQVSAALPPGAALVDFLQFTHATPSPERKGAFKFESRLLAFVLVAGREPTLEFLGSVEPVEKALQSWHRPVQTVPPGRIEEDAAHELAHRVWQPLEKHLTGVKIVLIAPDGPMCGLPFGALPGSKPGSFLIEENSIGYVTSGRHLLELAIAESPAGRGLLAVGGLVYGSPPDSPPSPSLPAHLRKSLWHELAGTQLEAERVAQTFRVAFPGESAPRLLNGEKPDADFLRRELTPVIGAPRWRYVHLATHGYFEPPPPDTRRKAREDWEGFLMSSREFPTYYRNPLLSSGLVVAGANHFPDKGILTAEEVADLDLRGVELAVLSACETGLGPVAGGEGVLGLQRAFQAAEARTLITSLWSVNDAATSVLMEEFYVNLWQKKLPKLEALRQAQLTVLRHPERVEQRSRELRDVLVKRGVSEAQLAQRGLGQQPVALPEGGRIEPGTPRRSPPAWWAAFVLSGDVR